MIHKKENASQGPILSTEFDCKTITLKLWQDFDAIFLAQNELASSNLLHQDENDLK